MKRIDDKTVKFSTENLPITKLVIDKLKDDIAFLRSQNSSLMNVFCYMVNEYCDGEIEIPWDALIIHNYEITSIDDFEKGVKRIKIRDNNNED